MINLPKFLLTKSVTPITLQLDSHISIRLIWKIVMVFNLIYFRKMSKTFKTINETFTLWKSSCEKTKREQMALFRKIEKHAAKLNKKEKRKFLNDAELFTEEFELKLSFPFTKLDELTAHYDQLSWEQENNKKRLSLYEVNLFSLFYLTRFLGQEIQPKKKSKNY